MFHMNRILIEQGGPKEKIMGAILPQAYVAVTISDFLRERQEVETTGFLKSVFWLVSFNNFYNKACITFNNVRYHRISQEEAQLEDFNGTLDLPIKSPAYLDLENQKQGIINGDRVQQAYVLYNPSFDQGFLVALAKINYPTPERVKPDLSLRDLVAEF